jgi:hypothetical protein
MVGLVSVDFSKVKKDIATTAVYTKRTGLQRNKE